MTSVLRRIEAPTRYAGLPLRAWAAAVAVCVVVAIVVTVFKTPLAPTLAVLSWFVVAPSLLLAMWAHQQGVSVPTLVADFVRYAARRQRGTITHVQSPVLRGGIVLSGPLPDPGATKPLLMDLGGEL